MRFFTDKSINCGGQNFEFKVGAGYIACGLRCYKRWMFRITLKINKMEYSIGFYREFPWPKHLLNIEEGEYKSEF